MNNAPGQIRHDHSSFQLVRRLIDSAAIVAALAIASRIAGDFSSPEQLFLASVVSLAAFFTLAGVSGLYRSWRGSTFDREMVCYAATWCFTTAGLLLAAFAARMTPDLSRRFVLAAFVAALVLATAGRLVMRIIQRRLRARGYNARQVAIVGVSDLSIQLARNLDATPELGLRVEGFYDDRPESRTKPLPEDVGRRIGNLDELVEATRAGRVQTIYLTFPMRAEERIRGVLQRLADTTASVYIVPDFFVFEMLHARWTNINGIPAVSVFENPLYGVDGLVKRVTDFGLALLALTVLAVPMLIIAAAVKLTSPGPVFFRQRRYGLDGREIRVWKFRSMRVCEDSTTVTQATKNDSRITPVGAFLRKTSLDELPQLFNVLAGDMSLVGPRPHATAHNEHYRKLIQGYMLRHKVKPGITGLAQVNGWRGETDTVEKMQKRIEFDHRYIRNWSIWLDLKILFRTFFVVLSRKNAY